MFLVWVMVTNVLNREKIGEKSQKSEEKMKKAIPDLWAGLGSSFFNVYKIRYKIRL